MRKPKQWNTLRILAKGAHFELTLNGVKTVDITDPGTRAALAREGHAQIFQTYGAERPRGLREVQESAHSRALGTPPAFSALSCQFKRARVFSN